AAHGVAIQLGEIAGVQLLVVRNQKLLGDGAPEPRVEHLLEVRLRRRRLLWLISALRQASKIQVVKALDELVLRELVDVLLERKIDELAGVRDERLLLHDANALT